MTDNSELADPQGGTEKNFEQDPGRDGQDGPVEDDNEPDVDPGEVPDLNASTKKKSKKKRGKAPLPDGTTELGDAPKEPDDPGSQQLSEFLKLNPVLAQQLGIEKDTDFSPEKVQTALRRLKLEDTMSGLASSGKKVKEMASYKFWGTQPVPKLGEREHIIEEGPFKIIDLEKVPKVPGSLVDGFEWVTMDLTDESELEELFSLLYGHYVEDDESLFRFNYSKSFLKWALMSPGWVKDWHVGVRATTSRKLVAFISAIPATLRVRKKLLQASEVNFLCIHKKLRSKRLAPVLIKEITRRCYLRGVWQAIYTAGIVLPKPISTCRYFHRALDWQKLYEVNFSPLPPKSKPSYQVRKYALPEYTVTKHLRPMEPKDLDGVLNLLRRYLEKFELAPVFNRSDIAHWLLPMAAPPSDQVVWSYVVEDPATKAVTDFFSFYCLDSSVINHPKHKNVRAAYMFYYATEHGLSDKVSRDEFSTHLNILMSDALILAKRFKFDVFNALTLMDNNLFLEQQKFGAGDGQLHYYLFNYNANPVSGGLDPKNSIDGLSEVGFVML
ncbi:Glycylpeptide [Podosphaera aphanis]|nr:Glycylpeptide [Podosphaera aphanis]